MSGPKFKTDMMNHRYRISLSSNCNKLQPKELTCSPIIVFQIPINLFNLSCDEPGVIAKLFNSR